MSGRVFLSSASGALLPYRQTAVDVCHRLGLVPVFMEEFLPDRLPPIDVCRDLVDGADVFVLLLAHRYGSRPPGESRSYTELEYDRALDRPGRPLLAFLADPEMPWPPREVDHGTDADALARFKDRVSGAHVVRRFTAVESFREDLLLALRAHEGEPAPAPADTRLPVLPRPHAVPPYVGSAPFTGRHSDLTTLDEWGSSSDPMMVVEAIGGIGKSALTWAWTSARAPEVIDGLAGRLWWSFYEGSASMTRFLREVLAYTTARPTADVRRLTSTELTAQVLAALRARPFLLVLDGFERLLNAYHRFDPAKLREDEIEPAKRSMIDPQAEDVLRELTTAGPSKILLSSRLMPDALHSRFGQPTPGVRVLRLPGLTDADTRVLLDRLGVRATGSAPEFFARLGNHPLLVGIVAGLVRDYRPDPGGLARWLTDPTAGGALALPELDLTQRRTHILRTALAGLSPGSQRVLNWLSVLPGSVEWPALEAINPFRPPGARRDEQAAQAGALLDVALSDLEERGLLWWDRATNSYDLHPIIRAYVFDRLEDGDRVQASTAVRDYFSALPPEDLSAATSVEDLRRTITIFRSLVGAGLVEEADRLWAVGLGDALLLQLSAYPTIVELLAPLTRSVSWRTRGDLTLAYVLAGRYEAAIEHERRILADVLADGDEAAIRTSLSRLGMAHGSSGALARESAFLQLETELVAAGGSDPEQDASLVLGWAIHDLIRGRVDSARAGFERAARLKAHPHFPWHAGDLHTWRLEFALRTGDPLTDADLAEQHFTSAKHQLRLARLRCLLFIRDGDFELALAAAEQQERLGRNAGQDNAPGTIAFLLAKLGRTAAATAAVEETLTRLPRLHPANRPHRHLAAALLELGRRDEALEHARLAYRQAWSDGPPHTYHWGVRDAADLLDQLGEKPPERPGPGSEPARLPLIDEVRAFLDRRT